MNDDAEGLVFFPAIALGWIMSCYIQWPVVITIATFAAWVIWMGFRKDEIPCFFVIGAGGHLIGAIIGAIITYSSNTTPFIKTYILR